MTGVHTVLVVDDEGDLAAALTLLEGVLLQLQPYADDDEPAAPDLGPAELEALQRISLALHRIDWAAAADFYGAGGFNFGKVHALQLADEDLAAVGRAVAALGASLLPGGDTYAREALEEFRHGPGMWGRERTSEQLVTELAQAHGLLDLGPDADVAMLAPLTTRAGRVDLDADQEAAYRRHAERLLAMKLGDPLERFGLLG